MKITARLSSSCNASIKGVRNNEAGAVVIQGGKIIDNELEKQLKSDLYNLVVKRWNLEYIIDNLNYKIKCAIPDGTFYFNLSLNLIEFEFIFFPKGKKICDGKLIVNMIPFKKYELSFDIDPKQLGVDIKKL